MKTPEELKETVKEKYSEIANQSKEENAVSVLWSWRKLRS